MNDFVRVINPLRKKTWGGRWYNVYIKIVYKEGRLSITGVEGPLQGGNCLGGCGQIDMHLTKEKNSDWRMNPNWTYGKMRELLKLWDKWHLNDMKSNCIHQEERGETWNTHPSIVCPDCGFKLGHGWTKREVPEEVLKWLSELPETLVRPHWV